MYLCKSCLKYTSINYGTEKITHKELLLRHLEGTSYRKLTVQTGLSKSVIQRIVRSTLLNIPNTNHLTELLCNRFSGYLQVDAKYVSVRGHERKMAFIWLIDYYTHDILLWSLVPTESFEAYYCLFRHLRSIGYQLKTLTCDDHKAIQEACEAVFPNTSIQLCLTHFQRNIQKRLDLRTNLRDRNFFRDIKQLLVSSNTKRFHVTGKQLLTKYIDNRVYLEILVDIDRQTAKLITHLKYLKCPATTNLIEGFNKHLAMRLKGLDGFKSYQGAELWLNGYVFWRRTTPFKSCKGKFKGLNGKISLSLTVKSDIPKVDLLRDLTR